MLSIYSRDHALQSGRVELIAGQFLPCVESPARAEAVLRALEQASLGPIVEPEDHGLAPIARVHDAAYLEFLENAWQRWSAERGATDALPTVWPVARRDLTPVPSSIDGALGYYSIDAGTPIVAGTWQAAYSAAQVALTGARRLQQGERQAFAACRPPGHHAGRDYYGGYCFLNNAAIAAQALRDAGAHRVAILDVDYHHGNGTQDIFYARGDVYFASIHADPDVEYPHFWGHAEERGVGTGAGATLNLPLPHGIGWPEYEEALATACRAVTAYGPEALVVSLGVDTFDGDPISRFRLRTADYLALGAAIAKVGKPTLFVLEGGYALESLGANVVNVLRGFAGD